MFLLGAWAPPDLQAGSLCLFRGWPNFQVDGLRATGKVDCGVVARNALSGSHLPLRWEQCHHACEGDRPHHSQDLQRHENAGGRWVDRQNTNINYEIVCMGVLPASRSVHRVSEEPVGRV